MEHRQAILVAMGILMAILPTFAVGLRLWARRIQKLRLGADDYFILASLVFILALCADAIVAAIVGKMGVHELQGSQGSGTSENPTKSFEQALVRDKTIWVQQWLAGLGTGLTKISVLLFYRRIFLGKLFNGINWVLLVLSVIYTLGGFFGNFLDCLPIQGNWVVNTTEDKADLVEDKCVKIVQFFWSITISDVVLDALILMTPWYHVWNLQMPVRQRISVCGIFMLGGFVIATGIVRLTALRQALAPSNDHSYTRSTVFYWNVIENGTGVVSACLPTLRPVFRRIDIGRIVRSFLKSPERYQSSSGLTEHDNKFIRASDNDNFSAASVLDGSKSNGGNTYKTSVDAMHLDNISPYDDRILVESSFIRQECSV